MRGACQPRGRCYSVARPDAMNCTSIMSPDPLTFRQDQTVGEAVGVLVARRFRSVPVVDAAGKMTGQFGVHAVLRMIVPRIATERLGLPHLPFVQDDMEDLRRRLHRFWDKPVGDYAEQDYYVVHPDTPLTKTVLSLYHTHDNLPVVDRKTGQLLGIISYWDIVQRLVS